MADATEDQAAIRAMPNGPWVVAADVPLVRKHIVRSEQGESLTWLRDETVETEGVYALCRCGGSANKPFCDGTHNTSGFDGSDAHPDVTTYDERAKVLGGTRIVVRDDRSICAHAGFCGNHVTNVWDMVADLDEDTVVRAQAMAMIERCPSGALSYSLEGTDDDVEPDLPAEIALMADGPLFVSGGVSVSRADGARLEERNRVTLCRCGASKAKPRCDGSHGTIGFKG
jgi:CDGSH-type Zn-finger protein